MTKSDRTHLRTHFKEDGLDYKGYNIAIHELGHCIERTINLFKTDNYLLADVLRAISFGFHLLSRYLYYLIHC